MKISEEPASSPTWSQQEFLEVVAVCAYLIKILAIPPIVLIIMIYLSCSSKVGLCLVLLVIGCIYSDRHIHETGGRSQYYGFGGYRDSWRYFKTYFPITVHKTEDLPADRNYLCAVCPHGVLAAGTISAFGSNAHNLADLFPGLKFYLATLKVLFYIPILRELLLMCGCVSVSQQSLLWQLGSPGVGRATALVVGGSEEANLNEPGVYKTLIKRRKGFCRIVLQTGASLVPVLSLGEVDLYQINKMEEGTWSFRFQQWVKKTTGVLPVRFNGAGFLGILPKRRPIHVIVGAPIHTEKKTHVSENEINELHERFISSLEKLFEENTKYLADPKTKLQFI